MKILHISDTHGHHRELHRQKKIPLSDVIIHSGDVCDRGDDEQVKDFLNWFSELPHKHKILVPGNHDFYFEEKDFYVPANVHVLIGQGVELDGVKFWGSPFTVQEFSWAFQFFQHDQEVHWKEVPDDTNVLITHGGAYKGLDLDSMNLRTGDKYLKDRLAELANLQLHLHGHIHCAHGVQNVNRLTTVNSAIADEKYKPTQNPHLVILEDNTVMVKEVMGL